MNCHFCGASAKDENMDLWTVPACSTCYDLNPCQVHVVMDPKSAMHCVNCDRDLRSLDKYVVPDKLLIALIRNEVFADLHPEDAK